MVMFARELDRFDALIKEFVEESRKQFGDYGYAAGYLNAVLVSVAAGATLDSQAKQMQEMINTWKSRSKTS